MTIRGGKNAHYICDLKMESEIACAHNVVLRAPGLVIDKAGVVSPTLVYDFAAGQGLVAQGLGWQGASAGTFPVDCDITSPYFVTPSGLKVKKDKFNITIEEAEPDGWSGTDHGLRNGGYNGIAGCTSPDLRYKYTHVSGFQTISFAPISTGESMLIQVSGQVNTVLGTNASVGASLSISTPGVYTFTPYIDGKYGSAALGPVVAITAQKTIGSFPAETVTPKRRGVQIGGGPAIPIAFNTPIPTSPIITVLNSYSPGNPTSALVNFSPATGIVFVQAGQFAANATGQFSSPPGSTTASVQLKLYDGAGTGALNNFAALGGAAIKASP